MSLLLELLHNLYEADSDAHFRQHSNHFPPMAGDAPEVVDVHSDAKPSATFGSVFSPVTPPPLPRHPASFMHNMKTPAPKRTTEKPRTATELVLGAIAPRCETKCRHLKSERSWHSWSK
jgi:hypothetical protein